MARCAAGELSAASGWGRGFCGRISKDQRRCAPPFFQQHTPGGAQWEGDPGGWGPRAWSLCRAICTLVLAVCPAWNAPTPSLASRLSPTGAYPRKCLCTRTALRLGQVLVCAAPVPSHPLLPWAPPLTSPDPRLGDPGALHLCVPRASHGLLWIVEYPMNVDRIKE